MQRRRTRRRGPLVAWLLAGVAGALAVILGVAALTDDDSGAPPAGPVVDLAAYEIEYRIEELGLRRSERVVVRRPYESLRSSNQANGRTATISNDDGVWRLAPDPADGWLLLDPGRRQAEADAQLLGPLLFLVDAGLAERHGDDTVVGRRCLTFRVAEPVASVATKEPTDDDHVDLCVDARTGILLREKWIAEGKVLREQEATRLDLTPDIDDQFTPTPAADAARQPQERVEIPLTEETTDHLEASFELPSSIEHDGGVAVVAFEPAGTPVGTVYRFLRRGTDVVSVEEVDAASRSLDRGVRHEVPIGEGYVETDLRSITLTIVLPSGTAVVLRGPDIDLLDTVAEAMRVE